MNRIGMVLAYRYELIDKIGSGGMADVYKAIDRKLNRYVAVKILRQEFNSDENFVKRFQQEAMSVACMQSAYVVNVYDVGEENNINYIVMEYAEGITLKDLIRQKGKLDFVESIDIAMQIATGIKEAHAHGIIHRDIKPQNVMISPDGKAKVMDFGIARAVTAQTITANTVGSVHYISPEQARGSSCDERCDIYSMGITLYEMVTGRVPFDGESTVAIALAHIKEPITPPSVYEPMIPVSLEKIILKCTQKKVEQRYSSAEELITDLKKALMTPDEDFVKEVVVNPVSQGTRMFSAEEKNSIKEKSGTSPVITKEENDYMQDVEEDEKSSEDEKEGKVEKLALIIGIITLIIVLLVGGLLIAHAMNLFKSTEEETQAVESEAETMAEDETYMPDVVNISMDEAISLLKKAELGYDIEQQADDNIIEGNVIEASEEAGAIVKKHTQITLYVSSGSDTVPIPDNIIGVKESAASRALESLNLKVKVEEEANDDYEEGYVFDCDPGVGEEVKQGSTVTIYVSNGEKSKGTVPNILGASEDMAESMLKDAGLVGDVTYEFSNSVSKGYVIRQNPDEGTKLSEGDTVSYVISKGVKVTVPNVTGISQDAALSKLSDYGLSSKVTQEYSDTVAEGKVISQSIDKGSEVEENTTVTIVVSLGPKITTVKVPSVIGKTEEEAQELFDEAGLKYKYMGDEDSEEYAEGTVCEIDYKEGSKVESGTVIGYYLSSGVMDEE